MLTERIGDVGKMIHTGRSRNDQVAVDIKLFLRSAIIDIKDEMQSLFDLLIQKSNEHKDTLIPGYTHLQIAMPSSIGLWLGAYAESLVDDMEFVAAAFKVANKNPLGSGAGYGSSFPLNRSRTTALLHFNTLNYNAVYAQMSRGKTEKLTAMALSSVAATLSRLAMDCCLFMSQNFGFIHFPDELTTGSSIMPHKKNPDVFELIRGKCNRIQAVPNELTLSDQQSSLRISPRDATDQGNLVSSHGRIAFLHGDDETDVEFSWCSPKYPHGRKIQIPVQC